MSSETNNQSDSESSGEIVLMATEGNTPKKIDSRETLWIADTGATCNMGPSLVGCTNIRRVNEDVKIGDGSNVGIRARATFRGQIINSKGKKRTIVLENYGWASGLDQYLLSVTYAMKKGFTLCEFETNGHRSVKLVKGKTKIEFDRINPKGSSYQMMLKVLADSAVENVLIGETIKDIDEVKV